MNMLAPIATRAVPERPVTIHRDAGPVVAFDGFGTITVTGPRKADLAAMVAAMPIILRQLLKVTTMLRERDGAAAAHVTELEQCLAEAGFGTDAALADEAPATPVQPASPAERFRVLLGSIADTFEALQEDQKRFFRTPVHVKDAIADMVDTIRAVLAENA